jgi:stage V sporulation protein R
MEIISQHTKKIMEGCKERARDAGLCFDDETLEYIVTNQDLLELKPKGMIPTLYDYWLHDLEIIKGKKEYGLYPYNPYETVINSRPALSFYNDNNPDWLNVMIFYHVLAHIDFMQNNSYFRHTWDDDFVGLALADKRLINEFRTRHGRWVDYVIEFTRGIDNITGYYRELSEINNTRGGLPGRIDYFFDVFLQKVKKIQIPEYLKEIDNLNRIKRENPGQADSVFISEVKNKYPEFENLFEKYLNERTPVPKDLIEYLMKYSRFLNREENEWMKSVMSIVRNTALYFEPQRRTKIMNEGWASYWHYELFLKDERIKSHEADFARVNAFVTALPKMGLNPYAVGWRLFQYIESLAEKGRMNYDFQRIKDARERKEFDLKTGKGKDTVFKVRSEFCDFNFINTFVDQDFVDRHKLVIIGERVNQRRMTREYYIKSKKAEDYKNMIIDSLIHPPYITVSEDTEKNGKLKLVHHYEKKQLVPEFIENVMQGLEFLWGENVELETHLIKKGSPKKIIYRIKDRKLTENAAG